MSTELDSKVPAGAVETKWEKHKGSIKLVSPANKRKHTIIVVGTGLAGASAAASLAELGYNVKAFCVTDSARRAHSIAAQGGINAAKNYVNDGDSIWRLFYDTVKGGDFRAREGNVYRLAENSVSIIDQCVAQGVPFAREYGGELATRSFGGAQVSRTFYARGQTGQQLLLGAYQALMRMVDQKKVELYDRREMLNTVMIDGKCRGIITRNLVTGQLERHVGEAVLLCTGGYGRVFYLSTNAFNSNATAIWKAHKKGALFGNPCYTQIHPTCVPVKGDYQSKLTLMSESLRNDGRVWVPKKKEDLKTNPADIAEADRDYYLERKYPAFGNLVPRDIASRAAKEACDTGHGVGDTGLAVYLDFKSAIGRDGEPAIRDRYGNLFDMYESITAENPYKVPMRIYPAVHYTMGGLWVDYNLMTTTPGLFALGEANFSDHGANRLGASALMQGLSDGYFIIPFTLGHYIAGEKLDKITADHAAFKEAENEVTSKLDRLMNVGAKGNKTVLEYYRELGLIMWNDVGMARSEKSLNDAISRIGKLQEDFWQNVKITGGQKEFNKYLELGLRVADFLELGELMARDALHREESCGGHFRTEHQTEEGEALRHDDKFAYVAAWEWGGKSAAPVLHKESLSFEAVKLQTRSYK